MKETACSAPWMVEVFRGTQLLGIEKNLSMMSCIPPHISQPFSFLSISISSGALQDIDIPEHGVESEKLDHSVSRQTQASFETHGTVIKPDPFINKNLKR